MSKKRKQVKTPLPQFVTTFSIRDWLFFLFIAAFLTITPYYRGLFNGGSGQDFRLRSFDFSEPILATIFLSGLVLIIYLTRLFGRTHELKFQDATLYLALTIPVLYGIAGFQAASSGIAHFHFIIAIFHFLLFAAVYFWLDQDNKYAWLSKLVLGSSFMIILFGYLNFFGDATFGGLIEYKRADGSTSPVYLDAVLVDSNGPRFASIFQYANTYAVIPIAAALSCIYILSTELKTRWFQLVCAGMIAPAFISLFLSLSRGGLVMLPVIVLLVLPISLFARQLKILLHLVVYLALSVLFLNPVSTMGLALQKDFSWSGYFQAWGVLILSAILGVAYALLVYYVEQRSKRSIMEKMNQKRFSRWYVPILSLAMGALAVFLLLTNNSLLRILPDNIQTRLENINFQQHSVLERMTFYSDAMKIIQENALFGSGGGAWATSYQQYQNNPYVSRQAHNFFLQHTIEVGFIGLLLLLIWIGIIFVRYLRKYTEEHKLSKHNTTILYIFAVSILAHSAIDFNMSYVYVSSLVFICLAALAAAGHKDSMKLSIPVAPIKLGKIIPVALLVVALFSTIISFRVYLASNNYKAAYMQAHKANANVNEFLPYLDRAISMHKHPDFLNLKLRIYNQLYQNTGDAHFKSEAERLIDILKHNEPHNRIYLENRIALLSMDQRYTEAFDLLNENVEKFTWDVSIYERLSTLGFRLGYEAQLHPDEQIANEYWDITIAHHARMLRQIEHLETLPEAQLQGQAFEVTPTIALAVGKIYYHRSDYDLAERILEQGMMMKGLDGLKKELSTYYLASMYRQDKTTDEAYTSLFSSDEYDRELFNFLVQD